MKEVSIRDPHLGQPILTTGASLDEAKAAILAVHGRGARAEDILSVATQVDLPDLAYYAPQAAGKEWYPNRFLVPLESNEPWLSSALAFLERALAQIVSEGFPPQRVILLGFSQGACLALEFAARHARRYGGLVGLSGALIGPDDTPRAYAGSLAGTPIFLGCSNVDPHVPKERVRQAADVLRGLGGDVTERLYPNLGHIVNQDEIDFVRSMAQVLIRRL